MCPTPDHAAKLRSLELLAAEFGLVARGLTADRRADHPGLTHPWLTGAAPSLTAASTAAATTLATSGWNTLGMM